MNKKRKTHRPGELDALYFDKLPQRCKEMFFQFMSYDFPCCRDKAMYVDVGEFYNEECESPIEQIFYFAFSLITFSKDGVANGLYLFTQQEVDVRGKHYRPDFLFDSDECFSPDTHFDKPLKLVIECDGHDYHEKTKEQVKKDNERDMALKMAGYDVLHFSGSQIYNEPFKCAIQTVDYILSKTIE